MFQFRATALVVRIRLDVSVAPGEEDIVSFISDTAIKALFVSALAWRMERRVRITVFCSATVIDVIVHCHTAGAF